jgi:glycosyltransferase involved in cell wall biosynthesis
MVSILLPTMRPNNIDNIVKNVTRQNYSNIELILIPQFYSEDQINLLFEKLNNISCSLKNIIILRLNDELSLGARLNKGIEASAGAYWAKMDDDDLYFPNYLSDMLLPFVLDDYAMTGKGEQFVYLTEVNKLILKNPGGRDKQSFVSGATFVVNRIVADGLRFGDLNTGEDTALIKMAKENKLKIYAADPFNHILIRSSSLDDHTWKFSADSFLKTSVVVADGMRTNLVIV